MRVDTASYPWAKTLPGRPPKTLLALTMEWEAGHSLYTTAATGVWPPGDSATSLPGACRPEDHAGPGVSHSVPEDAHVDDTEAGSKEAAGAWCCGGQGWRPRGMV